MKSRKLRIGVGLAATAAIAIAAVAWATPGSISTGTYQMPVTAEFESFPKVCDNRTSDIDLSGTLTFPGVGVELRFQNQDNNTTTGKGWHHGEAETTASLSIADLAIDSLPKQPSHGGVGGNPWIWVQLLDDNGDPVGSVIPVGRCVVGNSYKSGKYTNYLDADASAILSALTCDQHGAYVDIGADSDHGGLDAQVYFTNNRKWTHATDAIPADVQLNLADPFHAHKGSVVNGGRVTGNPLISAHFIDHNGVPLQDFIPLGRCNTLN